MPLQKGELTITFVLKMILTAFNVISEKTKESGGSVLRFMGVLWLMSFKLLSQA